MNSFGCRNVKPPVMCNVCHTQWMIIVCIGHEALAIRQGLTTLKHFYGQNFYTMQFIRQELNSRSYKQ